MRPYFKAADLFRSAVARQMGEITITITINKDNDYYNSLIMRMSTPQEVYCSRKNRVLQPTRNFQHRVGHTT